MIYGDYPTELAQELKRSPCPSPGWGRAATRNEGGRRGEEAEVVAAVGAEGPGLVRHHRGQADRAGGDPGGGRGGVPQRPGAGRDRDARGQEPPLPALREIPRL